MKSIHARILLIVLTILILSILPVPDLLSQFRPPWVFLLFFYVQCFLPRYFNVLLLLIAGLYLDVLLATVTGEHAFALTLMAWMINAKSRRFQFFSNTQQMVLVGVFCFIYQAVIVAIDALLGFHYILWMPFSSAVVAMFFWPWVKLLLDDILLMRTY